MTEPGLSPGGRRWLRRFRFAVAAIWIPIIALGAFVILRGNVFPGASLIAISVIMLILSVRRARYESAIGPHGPSSGEIGRPVFDYIVMAFIGIPLIGLGLLIISLVFRLE